MMARPFAMTARQSEATCTVVLRGELDGASIGELVEQVEACMDAGATDVLIDCRALEFMDSKGVGGLLELKARLEEKGGVLVLFAPPSRVRRTLAVTGLDTVFQVVDE